MKNKTPKINQTPPSLTNKEKRKYIKEMLSKMGISELLFFHKLHGELDTMKISSLDSAIWQCRNTLKEANIKGIN